MSNSIEEQRKWFEEMADRGRKNPQWIAQLQSDPVETLRDAGLRSTGDAQLVSNEIRRRAQLDENAQRIRAELDRIADRARRDPNFRDLLQKDPEKTLLQAGFEVSDASAIASEMHAFRPDLMCGFTCCRHPATDFSCDPSILV